ncbi:hypothetical protein AMATHDRAFT_6198 [Amanita thiersii Skay4041]|uniref:Uncharacterized protein n=1 Tax=Amanita thiersii Skay4041 TaxID=703135 RepID=A0A2A9NJY7_9AGAR|nr:hypothetical protein AMATHDRAFT_6198 [Amanita thiersii Skay4041]
MVHVMQVSTPKKASTIEVVGGFRWCVLVVVVVVVVAAADFLLQDFRVQLVITMSPRQPQPPAAILPNPIYESDITDQHPLSMHNTHMLLSHDCPCHDQYDNNDNDNNDDNDDDHIPQRPSSRLGFNFSSSQHLPTTTTHHHPTIIATQTTTASPNSSTSTTITLNTNHPPPLPTCPPSTSPSQIDMDTLAITQDITLASSTLPSHLPPFLPLSTFLSQDEEETNQFEFNLDLDLDLDDDDTDLDLDQEDDPISSNFKSNQSFLDTATITTNAYPSTTPLSSLLTNTTTTIIIEDSDEEDEGDFTSCITFPPLASTMSPPLSKQQQQQQQQHKYNRYHNHLDNNHGYSRHALAHVKSFWLMRQDHWARYHARTAANGVAAAAAGGISHPRPHSSNTPNSTTTTGGHLNSTHTNTNNINHNNSNRTELTKPVVCRSANTATLHQKLRKPHQKKPPPPLLLLLPPHTIHPRRGDLSALRDPYCAYADRCLVHLESWTLGKVWWMFDVHVAAAAAAAAAASAGGMSARCCEGEEGGEVGDEEEGDDSDATLVESENEADVDVDVGPEEARADECDDDDDVEIMRMDVDNGYPVTRNEYEAEEQETRGVVGSSSSSSSSSSLFRSRPKLRRMANNYHLHHLYNNNNSNKETEFDNSPSRTPSPPTFRLFQTLQTTPISRCIPALYDRTGSPRVERMSRTHNTTTTTSGEDSCASAWPMNWYKRWEILREVVVWCSNSASLGSMVCWDQEEKEKGKGTGSSATGTGTGRKGGGAGFERSLGRRRLVDWGMSGGAGTGDDVQGKKEGGDEREGEGEKEEWEEEWEVVFSRSVLRKRKAVGGVDEDGEEGEGEGV